MERGPIVQDYHALVGYMNRANKLANEKSDLKFIVDHSEIYEYRCAAVIASMHEAHRLVLAVRTFGGLWERAGYTRFKHIEEYCAYFLNSQEADDELGKRNRYLSTQEQADLGTQFTHRMRMLLLKKSYSP